MGALGLAGNLFGGLVEPGLRVQTGRCLRDSGSTCQACVDICPAGALRLTALDGRQPPQPDLSRCTDCGLCSASCPTGALTGVGPPDGALPREAERQSSAMGVVCAPARRERPRSEQDPAFSVSCLAALHPETVVAAALALKPGATLTLTRAQCSQCPSAQQFRVDVVAQESVDLLQRLDDGGRAIVLADVGPQATDDPQHEPVQPEPVQREPTERSPAGRRGWSRRELLTARRSGEHPAPVSAVTAARADLLTYSGDPSSVSAQLTHPVAAQGCTFCHACVSVCPTQALRVGRLPGVKGEPDDGRVRLGLAVDPTQCVGCGRCAQVCVDDLLTLGFASPPVGRGRLVVLARGGQSSCAMCNQPLSPGEQGECGRCASSRGLVADVLAR